MCRRNWSHEGESSSQVGERRGGGGGTPRESGWRALAVAVAAQRSAAQRSTAQVAALAPSRLGSARPSERSGRCEKVGRLGPGPALGLGWGSGGWNGAGDATSRAGELSAVRSGSSSLSGDIQKKWQSHHYALSLSVITYHPTNIASVNLVMGCSIARPGVRIVE